MKDVETVGNSVVDCFPEHYEILHFYAERYQNWMLPRIIPKLDHETLQPNECLKLASWVEKFKRRLVDIGKMISDIKRFVCYIRKSRKFSLGHNF